MKSASPPGRTSAASRRQAQTILRAILAADERGPGLPFSEAMDAAREFLAGLTS
jgi:hypothetical protein